MDINTHNAPNSSVEETAGLTVTVLFLYSQFLPLTPEEQERKSGHVAVFGDEKTWSQIRRKARGKKGQDTTGEPTLGKPNTLHIIQTSPTGSERRFDD